MQCCSQVRLRHNLYVSQKSRPQPTKSGGVECEADCATNDIAGGMLLYVGGEIIADPKLEVLEPCERTDRPSDIGIDQVRIGQAERRCLHLFR
jgi:hypothetical protein